MGQSSYLRFMNIILFSFKIADHDYYVYDFALPMVTLYTLLQFQNRALSQVVKDEPDEAIYDTRYP